MATLSGHSFSILEEFIICEKKKKKKNLVALRDL